MKYLSIYVRDKEQADIDFLKEYAHQKRKSLSEIVMALIKRKVKEIRR